MTPAQASRARLLAAFGAIYFIWGSTYLAIKIAIRSIPPFSLGASRFLIAGLLLYAFARLHRKVATRPVHWLHAFILGALMLGVGNAAVVWASGRMPSGLVALVVAVVPLFVVLIDWLRPHGTRPHGVVMVGVLVGLVGMALLVWPSLFGNAHDVQLGPLLVLLFGSVAWSLGTVFGRNAKVPGYPPLTSAMQLLGGGLLLTLIALVAGESTRFRPAEFSWQGVAALAYLIIFGSIVAFSAYSWLLRVANPARIATYAYVNPVVAIFLGWLVVDEKLTLRTIVAAGVILGGVALITSGINRDV
jgi:drug/metabolite transporter (DMT)-like permease